MSPTQQTRRIRKTKLHTKGKKRKAKLRTRGSTRSAKTLFGD